jgi:hypothetical protein
LIDAAARSDLSDDGPDRYPQAADAWLAAHDFWILRDPREGVHGQPVSVPLT